MVVGVFVTDACFNHQPCQRPLRLSVDAGRTWRDLDNMVIQVAWGRDRLYYSSHYDQNGDYGSQDWYHSRLWSRTLTGTPPVEGAPVMLLDHESGMLYMQDTLIVAQRVNATSGDVLLYSSLDGVNLTKCVFRQFASSELESASAYNIIDASKGR